MSNKQAESISAVEFYWRPGCPFCMALRRPLRRSGLPVREVNIWDDHQAAARVRQATGGDETVPTVFIGQHVLINPNFRHVQAAVGKHAPHLMGTQNQRGADDDSGLSVAVRGRGRDRHDRESGAVARPDPRDPGVFVTGRARSFHSAAEDHDGGRARTERPQTWSYPRQAVRWFLQGRTVRTAAPTAAVVGTALSAVNQGAVIAGGHATGTTWVQVAVNYAVPFTVASVGYLCAYRTR